MTRFTAVLIALCLLSVPAFAADAPASIVGSFAWQDSDALGRTWKADGELGFPMTSLLSGNVVFRAQYFSSAYNMDPDGDGSATLYSAGGGLTVYFTKSHNGPSCGANALLPMADISGGYLLEPFCQVELGTESLLFRARYSHPLQMSEDHDTIDLERDDVTVGLGWRF